LFLFDIISLYGFNLHQASDILKKGNETGARYYAEKYFAIIDRGQLWISPLPENLEDQENTISLAELPQKITSGSKEYLLEIKRIEDILTFNEKTLYLDCEKLPNTFTLRIKRQDDIIIPLGLPGQVKKMKDYLSDKKIPLIFRQKVLVMASENKVFAVIPWGISDDVKLGHQTRSVLEVSELGMRIPKASF
jgi:hypothetical protein